MFLHKNLNPILKPMPKYNPQPHPYFNPNPKLKLNSYPNPKSYNGETQKLGGPKIRKPKSILHQETQKLVNPNPFYIRKPKSIFY